jgi:hypothetical protein
MEISDAGRERPGMSLFGHLLQRLGYPRRLDIVRAARAAGVAGNAFPDQEVVEGLLAVSDQDRPDQPVRRNARLFADRTPGRAAAALIAGLKVLARPLPDLVNQ